MCERNKAFICESRDFFFCLRRWHGSMELGSVRQTKSGSSMIIKWKSLWKIFLSSPTVPILASLRQEGKLQMPIISKFPFKQMYLSFMFFCLHFESLVMCKKQMNNFSENAFMRSQPISLTMAFPVFSRETEKKLSSFEWKTREHNKNVIWFISLWVKLWLPWNVELTNRWTDVKLSQSATPGQKEWENILHQQI